MLEKVNICAMKTIPKCNTECILKNDKILNTRLFNPHRANILSSENIVSEVSGAVYCGENSFLGFNINPNFIAGGINYVTDTLEQTFQKMTDMGEELKGFICGGLGNTLETKNASASYALYNEIAEIFDRLGIQFGMICGKNKADSADNIRMHKDTIYMWGDYLHDCFAQKTKKPMKLDNISDIYDDVIMPEDIKFSLFLNNK